MNRYLMRTKAGAKKVDHMVMRFGVETTLGMDEHKLADWLRGKMAKIALEGHVEVYDTMQREAIFAELQKRYLLFKNQVAIIRSLI